MDNAVLELWLAWPSWYMSHYTTRSKYGNCTLLLKIKTRWESVVFTNEVGKNSRYFVVFFKIKQWARSIQPKFQPVRPGKVVHLKRWTRFFETFPVGPNRSIEFWTDISWNFGLMDRAQLFYSRLLDMRWFLISNAHSWNNCYIYDKIPCDTIYYNMSTEICYDIAW